VAERTGQVSATGVAAQPAPRRSGLPEGWPVLLLFLAFPLWWVLGLAAVIWVLLAIPMAVWLMLRRGVRVPKGFGIWLAFMFWMLLSGS
jgi:hypothetical protein